MKSSPWGEDLGEGETSLGIEYANFCLKPAYSRRERSATPAPDPSAPVTSLGKSSVYAGELMARSSHLTEERADESARSFRSLGKRGNATSEKVTMSPCPIAVDWVLAGYDFYVRRLVFSVGCVGSF